MGAQIVPDGADDAEDVNAPVGLEAFVFDGNDGLTEDGREVVVGDNLAALEGEGADDAAFYVVEFGGGGGAVVLEIVHLRQVDGVDEGEAGERTGDERENEQGNEGDGAGELAPMVGRQGGVGGSARAGECALGCRWGRRGA